MTKAQEKLVRRLDDDVTSDVDDQARKRRKVQPDEDKENAEAVHNEQSDKANELGCRLLELPGELRNRIYGYLTDESHHRHRFRTYNFIGQVTAVLPIECKALSQTSRQMRKEIRSYALKHGGLCITWEELEINKSFEIGTRGEPLIIRDIEIDITALSMDDRKIRPGNCDPSVAALWLFNRLSPLLKVCSLKYVLLKAVYAADAVEICFLSGFVYPGLGLVNILGNMLRREFGRHILVHADVRDEQAEIVDEEENGNDDEED